VGPCFQAEDAGAWLTRRLFDFFSRSASAARRKDSFDFRRSREFSESSASAGLVSLDTRLRLCAMTKAATVSRGMSSR
jgi:hypothetical protein